MSPVTADGPLRKSRRETGRIETSLSSSVGNPSQCLSGQNELDLPESPCETGWNQDGLSNEPSRSQLYVNGCDPRVDYSRPLAIELFCGSFGWSAGAVAVGFRCIGFDILHEPYHGLIPDHCELVLMDVLAIHGSMFKDADLILASSPCQNYSYLAMPWSRSTDPNNSKAAKALRAKWESEGPDNRLFDACARIQREACEAAGRYIPMIQENVRGAQPWVGQAKANYGSFYLWGDVEMVGNRIIAGGRKFGAGLKVPSEGQKRGGTKNSGGSWFNVGSPGQTETNRNPVHELAAEYSDPRRNGGKGVHLTSPAENESGTKIGGDWFSDPNSTCRKHGSRSNARKAASAQIAKIPLPLSRYIAEAFWPAGVPKGNS